MAIRLGHYCADAACACQGPMRIEPRRGQWHCRHCGRRFDTCHALAKHLASPR